MTALLEVAHVTTAHPHLDNRIFRKECVALAEAGIAVGLVAVAPQDELVDRVRVTALPVRTGRARRILLGPVDAWRALRRLQPRMIHVHDPELIPMAILWRLLHHRTAVYDAHEDLAKQVAGKTYIPVLLRRPTAYAAGLLERAADRFLDAVVVATPAISRNYRNKNLVLVQNFPWLRDYPEPTGSASSPRSVTLAYVGAITRERGATEMIEAVHSSGTAPQLVLAGSASPDVGRRIASADPGRVRYLGRLPAHEIPAVLAGCDAGLVVLHPLPNYVESQPTKLFEYMAAGKPFIASSFPAWRALLEKHECGYFVDPLDVAALTEAVDHLSRCPDEAKQMGARGRSALIEHFTFEAEAQQLVALTRKPLGAAP